MISGVKLQLTNVDKYHFTQFLEKRLIEISMVDDIGFNFSIYIHRKMWKKYALKTHLDHSLQ